MKTTGERIALAFSGELDPSVAIPWLKGRYGAEVIAVTLDLGRGRDLESRRARALAAGATRAHVLDARDEFVCDFILPTLKAGALSDDRVEMASALARPLIARKLVEIADSERATAVAHECVESSNAIRMEAMIRALNPALKIVAPSREWMTAQNGGDAQTLRVETKSPAKRRDETARVEITFDHGVPTAINGVTLSLADLISSLGTIAGVRGADPREICDGPAVVILHQAHHDLQRRVVAPDVDKSARDVSRQYAGLIHDGLWLTPLRPALDAFVERVQERVTGVVRLQLRDGGCRVIGRESPFVLDDQDTPEAVAACGVME